MYYLQNTEKRFPKCLLFEWKIMSEKKQLSCYASNAFFNIKNFNKFDNFEKFWVCSAYFFLSSNYTTGLILPSTGLILPFRFC